MDLNTLIEEVKDTSPLTPKEMKGGIANEAYQKLLRKNEAFLGTLDANPMYDSVVTEINGRKIKVHDKWLVDWASCNYLGFDLDREVMDSIAPLVQKWGTHPSWSRMLGNPILYEQLEERIRELMGVEDCLVLPNLTLISHYCIFLLSEGGEIFLDKFSHRTLYEGAAVARGMGASMTNFRSDDLEDLEQKLKMSTARKKLILVDGVFSMHGKYANIPKMAELARKYDALLYIDDAHGFGIVGERHELESSPYGRRGNGIVNHLGESYDNVVLITCLSKAYSSYGAFITCSPALKSYLKSMVSPYLYSGPVPVASLATALKGLEINEKRGDAIRADLYAKSRRFNEALNGLGYRNDNDTDFPIFNIYLKDSDKFGDMTRFLFENGVYVTLCPYPMVGRDDVGFRVQITASNTFEEVDHLIGIVSELDKLVGVQKRS